MFWGIHRFFNSVLLRRALAICSTATGIAGAMQRLIALFNLNLFRRLADTRGNVMMITAMAMPVLIGMAGLVIEGGNWYQITRGMQNAADSAALAASSNGGATFVNEARAVASNYGYTNGAQNATVNAINTAACPTGGATNCYRVTITQQVPLSFSRLVGFQGSTTVGTSRAVMLTAVALAAGGSPGTGCMLTLSPNQQNATLIENNANVINVNCDVYTNSNHAQALRCTNNCIIRSDTFTVGGVSTTGGGSLLGATNATGVAGATNPYASLTQPDVSATPCTTSTTVTTTSTINPGRYCGGINLSGNRTLTMTPGVYLIHSRFNFASGAVLNALNGVTIILMDGICVGTGGCAREAGIKSSVTLNIEAPTSGPYSGIAIFSPGVTGTERLQEFSDNVTMNIRGALLAPNDRWNFHNNALFNASICTQIIGSRVWFENNANMGTDCAGTGTSPIGGTPGGGRASLVG
jgi:Flp pilus assembly protein TadG